MTHFPLKRGTITLVAVLLLACGVWAQSAGFVGTILDPTGKTVAGATVTITNEATAAERSITTEADGRFVLTQLPPGKYLRNTSSKSFRKYPFAACSPIHIVFGRIPYGRRRLDA